MDRRNALLTLSGVMMTTTLLTLPRRNALAQATTALQLPLYRTETLEIGTFAKETSQVALKKAEHPKVREFAGFEVAEQTAIAQVLTNNNDPPPAPLSSAHQSELKQLQAQGGRAFDGAYVQGQIAGHHQLLAIQQAFLDGRPTDLDAMHIAVLARTVINMHLTMLQDLQNQLNA
jgi:predicted outer membrane protein